jgi:predicted dehydrogenase
MGEAKPTHFGGTAMSKLTRRSFLEQTLATAAAGLAAASLASSSRGDETAAAPKPRPSSDERIRHAVIGLNGRGQAHLESFSDDQSCDIVAICDVDTSMFKKSQQNLKNRGRSPAKEYQDIRQLLDDKEIQSVSIATPNHWHTLAAIWAMQAGKHVYVEKPVSHNISEGRRLEQARVKYGLVCQGGTQSRSSKAISEAIKFVHDGGIGKVSLSRALCYKGRKSIGHFEDSTAPETLNYDIWQGPAPVRPFNKNRFLYEWHWNWAYGNGDIGNQGIHQMDIARWSLKDQTLPTSALSVGGRFGYVDDGQTPNTQLAFFDFGGPQALFEVRGLKTEPLQGVSVGNIIYGSEGMIAVSFGGKTVQLDKEGKVVKTFKGGDVSHFSNFINAVRTGKQEDLHAPVLETHYSSAMCHMANTSYRLGTPEAFEAVNKSLADNAPMTESLTRFEKHLEDNALALKDLHCQSGPALTFDPKAENWGANEAANAMLTREYRPPFVVPATL